MSVFKDVLVKYHMKSTYARVNVLKVLWNAEKPLTTYQVHAKISLTSLPTVYRTLNDFVASGLVTVKAPTQLSDKNTSVYELSKKAINAIEPGTAS